jgi:hypothetical protein
MTRVLTGPSSNRNWLFKRTFGEIEDLVHLLSVNRRKPLEELLNG